jgi:ATP-dependent Clp protease ATP-binding subunit ClpC
MENVKYIKNNKRVAEAKLSGILGKSFSRSMLQILVFAGAASFLFILTTSFWSVTDMSWNLPAVALVIPTCWLFVTLSLISVLFLNLGSFLKAQEVRYPIGGEATDLGLSSDFRATILLARSFGATPDLAVFLKLLVSTPEVSFILSELEPNESFWGYVRAGMGTPKYLEKVFNEAAEKAMLHSSPLVSSADLFWGLLSAGENYDKILSVLEVEESDLSNIFFLESKMFSALKYPKTETEKLRSHSSGIAQGWDAGYTNYLNNFSHDVLAGPDEEFSIEGRKPVEAEIENILTKENKNNIILTGPVGVGKSTLIKGLISRIVWGKSLPTLAYQRVVELDLGAIISHAGNRADLEQVMISVLNDAVRAGNIILYVPNIQDIFAGGTKEGTIDASEIIMPYLRESSLRIIGATTEKAYETYIEAKPELASMFTKIAVPAADKADTLRILAEMSVYMGSRYQVRIAYSALKEIYLLTERYVTEKEFPGKAVDMLENICSSARNEGIKVLNKETVAKVAEKDMNIHVAAAGKDEKAILLGLEDSMHKRVVGQFQAVKAVADSMRRARADVKNDKRPVGSFLFLGPTGVGKTELAKTLSESYFGDESKMIRMDMNEFQDTDATSRFIGKKAAGSEELEGGEFVKQIRSNPSSLILLDEIEKANPNILDLFLQALDEGYITDGMGERVILSGSIIIATSNAGANTIRKLVETSTDYQVLKEKVLEEVQTTGIFKPEFLNRFDGVIMFTPLSATEILKIAELEFKNIQEDFKGKGYDIELGPGVLEKLAQEGYVPEMGARPMRRVFQDRLENYLAKKMLEEAVPKGEPFVVNMTDLY